ncbi:hypothetical protein EN780_22010 [Mesorhizobium sp. M4B.F.Ca.ET.089.01.1.1]|nr:hypothetical protein EN780_22010 [Mesorhizobium sp. M4B.F.Ca.ET.089.01.1.1]
MPVFMPWPPAGLWMWPASPHRNTRPARKRSATLSRNGRTETVSAAYLAGCDGARSAVRHGLNIGFPGGTYEQSFYRRNDRFALVLEGDKLGVALDLDAGALEMRDQQAFVDVLRQREGEGVGADTAAEIRQRQPCRDASRRVQGQPLQPHACGEHVVDDADLAVELQRAGLDRERARGLAGSGGLVEDAHRHAEPGQPQRQRQAGRTGAGNQDLGL